MKATNILLGILILLVLGNIYVTRMGIKQDHAIRMQAKKADSVINSNNAEMNAKLVKITARLDSLKSK